MQIRRTGRRTKIKEERTRQRAISPLTRTAKKAAGKTEQKKPENLSCFPGSFSFFLNSTVSGVNDIREILSIMV